MEDEYLEKRTIFLDVVEAKVELGEVGQGDEGGAGNLLQIIIVQVQDAEVGQTLETVLGDGTDPVLELSKYIPISMCLSAHLAYRIDSIGRGSSHNSEVGPWFSKSVPCTQHSWTKKSSIKVQEDARDDIDCIH